MFFYTDYRINVIREGPDTFCGHSRWTNTMHDVSKPQTNHTKASKYILLLKAFMEIKHIKMSRYVTENVENQCIFGFLKHPTK